MTESTNNTTQTQTDETVPSLTLSDLVSARNVAKVAVDGKFFKRGDEAKAVEAIYNKLNNFVMYADLMNKKAEGEADEAKKSQENPSV